jgi:predicted acylesterase/phospholipase RssA
VRPISGAALFLASFVFWPFSFFDPVAAVSMTKQSEAHPPVAHDRPPFECIALVLQGGGALGAYQAGVYQALAESGVDPDWICGISIGAFNSAIIAGNPPGARVDKLRSFGKASPSPMSIGSDRLLYKSQRRKQRQPPLRWRRNPRISGNSPPIGSQG